MELALLAQVSALELVVQALELELERELQGLQLDPVWVEAWVLVTAQASQAQAEE